jgi:hypothetical protein
LPLDPSFAGSNPDEDNKLLRAIKICSVSSFGWEVKLKEFEECKKKFKE